MEKNKKVTVLLSSFNGEKYLENQLKSIISQRGVDTKILVRDDGSTDDTINILDRYKESGYLDWYTGDNLKPARSFLDLISHTSNSDYFAFCDQDDIWDENKLEIAVNILDKFDPSQPSLYFSNVKVVDENLVFIEKTSLNPDLDLAHSLIHYSAFGCTEVFNQNLVNHIKEYKSDKIESHDNWIYKVCLSLDGNVFFDENSYILYRQHSHNFIGINNSFWKTTWNRFLTPFKKKDRQRMLDAKQIISGYWMKITPANREILNRIVNYRTSLKNKLALLFDKRFKSKNRKRNILFYLSVLFGSL